jgi:FtsP/CotA-like multicopper oxidase with cupredoxin domain
MICPRLRRFFVALTVMLVVPASGFAAKVRHYYIAAEDVTWDYAPSGKDLVHGASMPEPWRAQTRWNKTRYIEYTDATFSIRKSQPNWLGILGPIIRAEVGDTVLVTFLNRSEMTHSIHPHGLHYDKDNEGSVYLPYGAGAGVEPGGSYTYKWFAGKNSGPAPGEPSSVVWWYHGHVEPEMEINAGLLGPIIVTAAGKADARGAPKDVDREFVVMFMIFNELHGKDAGMFHSINGYVFGNLHGLMIKQGERVRWHLLGMGDEKDLHSPHWHGETVTYGKRHTDVIQLLPASMVTADMIADNPGTWLFECHVSDHMEAGMMVTYTIYSPPRSCPVTLLPDDWNKLAGTSAIRVRNSSVKPIRQVSILSGYLVSVQELQPLILAWFSPGPIKPGDEQTVAVGTEMFETGSNVGVAFYPGRIVYQDGTEWKPKQLGECFRVYWRDKAHPRLPVLPPFQFKHKED